MSSLWHSSDVLLNLDRGRLRLWTGNLEPYIIATLKVIWPGQILGWNSFHLSLQGANMLNKNMRILGSGLLLGLASFAGSAMAATFTMSLADLQEAADVNAVSIFSNAAAPKSGPGVGACDRLRRTWTYNGAVNKFKQVETITNSNTSLTNKCPITEKHYVWADEQLNLVRAINRNFDPATGTAYPPQTITYTPGILVYTATMNSGDIYHNFVKINVVANGVSTFSNAFVGSTQFTSASAPVTIAMGTYNNCWTVETNLSGTAPTRTMRCPGVGNVAITNMSQSWVRLR